MAIKQYNPTTPGRRGMTTQDFSDITTKKPLRSLLIAKRKTAGRNNQGRITTRHKGGSVRKFYRLVNFNLANGISGKIEQIEYDPNRSARIARIKESNGTYHYVLAVQGMQVGQSIVSSSEAPIETGNRLPLKNIPIGSTIHAIELKVGGGAQLVRSAGNSAQLMGRDNGFAQIRLPSSEVRLVNENCTASVGVIGNEQHQNVKIGKAGRNRLKGKRPSVRGVVMNAADHPHGGGDGGRHGIGGGKNHGAAPKTPWGQKTLGFKTRRRKSTSKFILRTRHQGKRR
ncbi:MAG TPA: 50S ribosomal protein L2 [Candidatus Saccharimonadales bacterium]|nr:50S ribosomal protein L2 [Candidatus Saccharimonadales bacterium]